jgi:CheY-like chemotaxis protein
MNHTMAHILVIEDEEVFRFMLQQMLSMDGHQVTLACDGEEGLRLASSADKPDLIITDVLMPNMDGIETVAALTKAGNAIPIIGISGSVSDLVLNSLPVNATLCKPFSRADLRLTIKKALPRAAA